MPGAVCIALVGGAVLAALDAPAFTLAWTHSVERIEWQEDWRVEEGALVLSQARVRGHGAGMEIPDGARLEGGWWRFRPDLDPVGTIALANSSFTADYTICTAAGCHPLAAVTGVADRPVALSACPHPTG